jgi:hypothetical protein
MSFEPISRCRVDHFGSPDVSILRRSALPAMVNAVCDQHKEQFGLGKQILNYLSHVLLEVSVVRYVEISITESFGINF